MALQMHLDQIAEGLAAMPVILESLNEGADLVRSIGRVERALEGAKMQVARQIDDFRIDGKSLSAEDILAASGKLSDGGAKRAARRAHLARSLPNVGAAGDAGQLGAEHLDAIALARWKLRNNPQWQAAFDQNDPAITHKAGKMRLGPFRQWLRQLVTDLSDDGANDLESERARNRFRMGRTESGRLSGSFELDALSGEILRNMVRSRSRSLAKQKTNAGEEAHYGEQLDAEAFIDLISSGGPPGRPMINAVVDLETLKDAPHPASVKRTEGGLDLPLSLIQRFLCDSWIRHVGLDQNGVPLAVGRASRTATEAQRSALAVMYETCACCETAFADCEIHHIIPWESGGLTDLANLIPLCSTHHHKVHEGGWSIRLDANRNLRLFAPSGELWQTFALQSAAITHLRRRRLKLREWSATHGSPPDERRWDTSE